MSVKYSYLALEDDHRLVAEWFAGLDEEKTVNDRSDRLLLYFRGMAKVPLPVAVEVDQDSTPLVFIVKPQRVRGTLWTDAEVLFRPTPLRPQFPALDKISRKFAKWIKQFELVFSQKNAEKSDWKYYLEAGIQNFDEELYALPKAYAALQSGQYFVHYRASLHQIDVLAKSLRLREYHVDPA
jgi:hypothetical protein